MRESVSGERPQWTRLSRLHPYPAMVADELALNIADCYVKVGDAVLDPFCGSGRLLAAAAHLPGKRVGFDANPLACLLTRAKLANPKATILGDLLQGIERAKVLCRNVTLELRGPLKVEWFPRRAIWELAQIIDWINRLKLEEPERLIVAAVLSGAARDASYARKDCWKLHRLNGLARRGFFASPWDAFERRLLYCFREISHAPTLTGDSQVKMGDSRQLIDLWPSSEQFDVILTSPPYGDSRTTVQYGAASALCLEFVSRIKGFEELFASGSAIDSCCLGGRVERREEREHNELRPYWAGRSDTPCGRRVSAFLVDYEKTCSAIARRLRPGGIAIVIVGQRSTGGYRVKLDEFTIDKLGACGLRNISVQRRNLKDKRLPRKINRYARSASLSLRNKGTTPTISTEIIVVFKKLSERVY